MAVAKTIIHITFRPDAILKTDTIDSPLTTNELVESSEDYQVFYGFWDVDGAYTMHNSADIQTIYFEPVQNDAS